MLLVLVALAIWTAQFFHELKAEVDTSVLYVIGGVGLIIWLGLSDDAWKAVKEKLFGKKN